jgi:hypothetical protein
VVPPLQHHRNNSRNSRRPNIASRLTTQNNSSLHQLHCHLPSSLAKSSIASSNPNR